MPSTDIGTRDDEQVWSLHDKSGNRSEKEM